MLALRLARGSHPFVLVRRLLVAAASAGVGFLLLCALGYAAAHPASAGSVLRLLWCFVPLAATVQFAVAVARADPSTRPRPGLSSVGLGPVRLSALAAVSTAVSTTLGSMVALLFFLHLRGDLTGMPFDGGAAEFLGAGSPLPLAAALMLLALVPVAASTASALALRSRPDPARDAFGSEELPEPAPAPAGLPWGVALTAAGLAVEAYASREATGNAFPLPGRYDSTPVAVLIGWTLTAVGLAMAGPSLTYLCGRALQAVRPGAVRLLAGRVLMIEARRIGRPLGVVCAVLSAAIAASALYGGGERPYGPLTALGAVLVLGCTAATLLTSALEAKHARAHTVEALLRMGAPAATLRRATALRAGALLALFAPLTWVIAQLAALPLTK